MSTIHLVPADLLERYHVKEWRNAAGVLSTACPTEWAELQQVLRDFKLLKSEVRIAGGNRSLISQRIDKPLYVKGWVEKQFKTSIDVDGNKIESPTHAVDCFKGGVAVEMEWNNKDPFFDRDLNNFRLLFELRAIQVGVVITRAWELQEIFKSLGKGSSYGKATTHHEKLWPKVEGGGGGGCPVLTFAIKPINFVDDGEAAYLALKEKAAQRAGQSEDEDEGVTSLGSEVYGFLRKNRFAVLSTINSTSPQAAVVGIAVTEALDLVFDTLSTSRKYANLRADPRVALVVWDGAQTVQYEGVADLPDGTDLDACKRIYFEAWPDGPEREKWPDIAYVRIRPRWIRFSDFGQTPARIEELNLAR